MRERRAAHLRIERIAFQEYGVLHRIRGRYALIEPAECDAYTTSERATLFFGTGSVRRP